MSSNFDVAAAAACRKRRRGGQRVFKFKSFGDNGCPVEFDGSFRENVKALLEYGHLETSSYLCNGLLCCWSFQLEVHRHPPLHILLFVVEEPIEGSINLYCKHCQYIGWGHHMICNKKYHFLLPSKDTVAACFNSVDEISYFTDDPNAEKGKFNLLELQGHLMHGVFHSNGFGHLLYVNGVELGSDLAGYQIMEFWDRLCTGLQARKVSLKDTSKKRGMELRLLYGVAYGEPWFGRWGYKFGRGCYGVNQPIYQKAIEAIQGIPLCLLSHHLSICYNDISVIFSRYQALSDHSMVTLADLFHFMLELKSRLPKDNSIDSCSNPAILAETTCRWSPKRVEATTRVIVEALKRAEYRWVSRQEVRDAARAYIGDTGLLDFVLKSLGNHIVGNYLVRRCLNPVTKVLEYRLEDISTVFPNSEALILNNSKAKPRCKITKAQLMKDIFCLYKHIFKELRPTLSTGVFSAIPMAARIILDTKFFVKEYTNELSMKVKNGKLKLFCTVILRNYEEIDHEAGLKKPMPPFERVTLNENATFDDLKVEVEKNFREVYWRLRSFVVENILNLSAKGSDLVVGSVEMSQKMVFLGSNDDRTGMMTMNNELMVYECGLLNSRIVVDCPCGAKEDDGERLVSCDICEVWQHTRCVKIPNNEEIPHVFLCKQCEEKIVFFPSLP